MTRTARALNLLAVLAAALWFAHSPAAAAGPASTINLAQAAGAANGPEHRIALVIGNSNYEAVKALPNPVNDAEAVTQLFSQAGFEVVIARDLSRALMRQVISEFAARVAEKGPNSVALVYYAGHGLQVDGDNYLVPVDANLKNASDVPEQAVRLADLMATLETAPSKARIVILDACRNNPFSALNDVAGKGLAIVDAPAGSIVAYSTAPGTEAFDGQGRHSPYAAALMRTIKTPNLPIEQVFKKVRLLVDDVTGSKQMPWESTSLTSDFVFFTKADGEATAPAPVKVAVAELRTRSVRDAYEVVVAEDQVEYYEEFVRLYPSDPLCDFIRRALARRLQMIAWHKATKLNNAAAYAAFLAKYGNTDFAKAAKKLHEQPKLVSLGKIGVKIDNAGIKAAPVIPFQKNGQNGNGQGNGLGIKTGNLNGQNGLGTAIKTDNLKGQSNNGIKIKPGTVITPTAKGTAIKAGTVIPATGKGENSQDAIGAKVGNLPADTKIGIKTGIVTKQNGPAGNTTLNNIKIKPKVLSKPAQSNRQLNQIKVQPKFNQNQSFNRNRASSSFASTLIRR